MMIGMKFRAISSLVGEAMLSLAAVVRASTAFNIGRRIAQWIFQHPKSCALIMAVIAVVATPTARKQATELIGPGFRACFRVLEVLFREVQDRAHNVQVQLNSWIMVKFGTRLNPTIHSEFQTGFTVVERKSPAAHSHAVSAAERTAVTGAIDNWIRSTGREIYTVSGSSRDRETVGYHQFYMARDFLLPPRNVDLTEHHVIKMVDVDYHVNMPRWISYGKPILLYSFVPMKTAGTVEDGHFNIVKDTVNYFVNGGARYKHQLWDYNRDWIVTDYWWGSIVSSIDTRHVSDHRRIVLITPSYQVRGPFWWFVGDFEDRLKRQRITTNGVNRLDCTTADGDRYVSLALEGEFCSVEVKYDLLSAIEIRRRESKKPEIHVIERYLMQTSNKENFPQPAISAALLHAIYEKMIPYPTNLLCRGGSQTILKTFQTIGGRGHLVTEDGIGYGRIVGLRICDKQSESVVPRESYNNDLSSVNGRVKQPHNDIVPPGRYHQYAAEFIKFLIPDERAHKGVPWTIERIEALQCRQTQKLRNDRYRNWLTTADDTSIRAFLKHETMAKISEPRCIQQVSGRQTLLMACYVYAFTEDIMKDQPWYAPGKTPKEIAERIQDVAQDQLYIGQTDYSRFDATVSMFLSVYVDRASLLRWVHPQHRDELAKLYDAEKNAQGRTKHGVAFDVLWMTITGGGNTTSGNTKINAFTDYCAGRVSHYPPSDAWKQLGIYGGDDGNSKNEAASAQLVAKELGLKLEHVTSYRGESVRFLGRLFLDPWTTDASVQDPIKSIPKLHISITGKDVPEHVALFNRANGYLELDPTAPIVSAWCRRTLRRLRRDFGETDLAAEVNRWEPLLTRDRPYYSHRSQGGSGGGWPQPAEDCELAYECVATALGVDAARVHEWHDRLDGEGEDSEVQCEIQIPQAAPKIGAIVTGDTCVVSLPVDVPNPVLPTARVAARQGRDMVHATGRPEPPKTRVVRRRGRGGRLGRPNQQPSG